MLPFDAAAVRRLPEFIIAETIPAARRPRLIATGYATTLDRAFSGSSFHLAKAGMAGGEIEGCFTLQSPKRPDFMLNTKGAIWKLAKHLSGRRYAGFKFAPSFHDHVWGHYGRALAGAALINNIQMYGERFWRIAREFDIAPHFYIDGTLNEYFTNYASFDVVGEIDPTTMEEAKRVERDDYARATHIFAMSRRSADDLQSFYSVPAEKISVISPGANLPDEAVEAITVASARDQDGPFVLGFVGLYPLRKGLDRLAKTLAILRGRGRDVVLRAIGECPEEIARQDGVEALGVIGKGKDLPRFLAALATVDLGCQLSKAEMVGVAMLEFLRLGIPVLATDVGGIPEVMSGGGGILVRPDIDAEELAELLSPLVDRGARYGVLKAEAEAKRGWASWARAARELDAVLTRSASGPQ